MQIKLSKSVAGIFIGTLSTGAIFAHPGHGPTDTAAQLAHPFAGVDHFAVFLALASVLLLTLRAAVRYRAAKMEMARRRSRSLADRNVNPRTRRN